LSSANPVAPHVGPSSPLPAARLHSVHKATSDAHLLRPGADTLGNIGSASPSNFQKGESLLERLPMDCQKKILGHLPSDAPSMARNLIALWATSHALRSLAQGVDFFPQFNRFRNAVQWYRNRMEDLLLIEDVYPDFSKRVGQAHSAMERSGQALFRFAARLSQDDPRDRLGRFLLRYGSTDTDVSGPARNQVDGFIGNRAKDFAGKHLRDALDLLSSIPIDERDAMCHQDGMTEADVSQQHRRWLLPPPERALLEPLGGRQAKLLSQFSAALLREGHGGASEWMAMVDDGRARLARELLMRHIGSQQGGAELQRVLVRLQEQAGIPAARRLT